jgi:acyl dehydratase
VTLDSPRLNFDRTLIGRQSQPSTVRVIAQQLKFFAKAIDQRNPIYFDEAAAKAAGHPELPMPPTFAFSLILAAPEQSGYALQQINADPRYILHAEQEFRYRELIYAGDEVSITTRIEDLYEKKGGTLHFLIQRHDLRNQAGVLCLEASSTFVMRSPEDIS